MRHPRFVSGELKCGLRVNPQCSTGHTPIYDPCAPGSRLGVTPDMMQGRTCPAFPVFIFILYANRERMTWR